MCACASCALQGSKPFTVVGKYFEVNSVPCRGSGEEVVQSESTKTQVIKGSNEVPHS